jgi:hypothetical protein
MSVTDTHLLGPIHFDEANGVRYAYRRFGWEEEISRSIVIEGD